MTETKKKKIKCVCLSCVSYISIESKSNLKYHQLPYHGLILISVVAAAALISFSPQNSRSLRSVQILPSQLLDSKQTNNSVKRDLNLCILKERKWKCEQNAFSNIDVSLWSVVIWKWKCGSSKEPRFTIASIRRLWLVL